MNDNASEVLAAWETSSQYWNKHQALIEQMYTPLSRALIEEAGLFQGRQCSMSVAAAANLR